MHPALKVVLLSAQKPALDFQFTSGVLDNRITASGGANGTVLNSSGVLVAASCPRFDYNAAGLSPLGLLVEGQSTNLLLNSKIDGTNLSTQSVTTTAQAYTLSFYGTGTITLSGAFSGSLVGSGSFPTRSTLTFTSTAASLTLTVSGAVQYAQLETGSVVTSFIPTAGASVTRTKDVLSFQANLIADYSRGTIIVEGRKDRTVPNGIFLEGYVGGSIAGVTMALSGTDGVTARNLARHGANRGDFNSGATLANGTFFKSAISWGGSAPSASVNGAALVNGATPSESDFTSSTLMYIGARGDGTLSSNCHISRIRWFAQQFQSAKVQGLTI